VSNNVIGLNANEPMTDDQKSTLRTITADLSRSRADLLEICDDADASRDDFADLGDGLPGSMLFTFYQVIELLGEMETGVESLHEEWIAQQA
jgi:hypothetical protein